MHVPTGKRARPLITRGLGGPALQSALGGAIVLAFGHDWYEQTLK